MYEGGDGAGVKNTEKNKKLQNGGYLIPNTRTPWLRSRTVNTPE